MTWTNKTWYTNAVTRGAGGWTLNQDNHKARAWLSMERTGIWADQRVYHYAFQGHWTDYFSRLSYQFRIPFHTIEESTNGDSQGHWRVLADPDFTINEINVVEWARQAITRGRADLKFIVHRPSGFSMETATLELIAQFSDPRMATLFKLQLGGR